MEVNVNCEQNKTAKFGSGCRKLVFGKYTGCVKVECVDCVKRFNFLCFFFMLLKPLVVYVNSSIKKNNHSIFSAHFKLNVENAEKILITQLKSRLQVFNVIRRPGSIQYIPEHDIKRESKTHCHTLFLIILIMEIIAYFPP